MNLLALKPAPNEETPNTTIERIITTGNNPENNFKLNAFINGGYAYIVVRSIRLRKIS